MVGVRRRNKRRMDDVRVEVTLEDSFEKKLVRSRLKWASRVTRVERMGGEQGSDAQKVEETRYEEHRGCDGRRIENNSKI